jgi:hypothetical protein
MKMTTKTTKNFTTILNAKTLQTIKGGQTTEPEDDCKEHEPAKPVVVLGSVKFPVGG